MGRNEFLRAFVIGSAVVVGQLLSGGCEYPYSPDPLPPVVTPSSGESRLKAANIGQQVCNVSISKDPRHPDWMLWLNFQNDLGVTVPAEFQAEYKITGAAQHDRLTVTDTGNTVRWYTMRPAEIKYEMQDPEWSWHPDYIALVGAVSQSMGVNVWSGFCVRMSDKAFFKWNDKKVMAETDPFLWLPENTPAASGTAPDSLMVFGSDGFVQKQAVKAYFGTDTVKLAFCVAVGGNLNMLRVSFIDFSQAAPAVTELAPPKGRETWKAENPQISPDGNWVAFSYHSGDQYAAYIQELRSGSEPVLVAEPGADPRWWRHPTSGAVKLVYATVGGPIEPLYKEGTNDDGSIGYTYVRSVALPASGGAGVPVWTMLTDNPVELLKWPFRGGMSPDGRFLATGYKAAYMYVLP